MTAHTARSPIAGRTLLRWLAAFFFVTWLLGATWAVATPVMEFPDEPSHVRKAAAVVRGQLHSAGGVVRVPESIATLVRPCWITVTPPCEGPPPGDRTVVVNAESYHGRSFPPYYAVVGVPTLVSPGTASVYAMRVVSAGVVALLLTIAAGAAVVHRRPHWVLVGLAAAVTPTTLFLAGAVNPNGVEIAAGIATWLTLIAWLGSPRSPGRRWAGVLLVAAALTLLAMRPLSPLWLAVIIVACLALEGVGRLQQERAYPGTLIGCLLLVVAVCTSIAWTAWSGTLDELIGTASPRYHDKGAVVFDSLLRLGNWEQQMVAMFSWNALLGPFHVFLAWFAVIAALVMCSFMLAPLAPRLVLVGLLASTAVIPVGLQFHNAAEKGLVWQGRYLLPLAVGIPIVSGVILARSDDWHHLFGRRRFMAVPLVVLGAAHLIGFWWALHGNIAGASEPWFSFHARWTPFGGWIGITSAFALMLALWVWVVLRLADVGADLSNRPGKAVAARAFPD